MGIGVTLKELLKAKSMTAKELSEKTGISVNTIYAILKRDNDSIKPESLSKISDALEVDPDYILGISREATKKKADFNHKLFLINEWLEKSNYKILHPFDENGHSIIDRKRSIGIYISNEDIENLYSEIKNSCENVIETFIEERLKKEGYE